MCLQRTQQNSPPSVSSEQGGNPGFQCCLRQYLSLISRQPFFFLHVSKLRHLVLGRMARHIFCCGKRMVSLSFQDKEGVGNAGLKLVALESRVEASLRDSPSRGR